jgi:hypothetical protein
MPKDDAAACRKALPIRISSCFLPDAKAKYVPVCLAPSLPPALALQQEKLEAAK